VLYARGRQEWIFKSEASYGSAKVLLSRQRKLKEHSMEDYRCPRCNETMDEGTVRFTDSAAWYISKKQRGIFKKAAIIREARACSNCGYVEMYLDPKQLKRNIS
jgi:hypothetical protein